MTLNITLVLHDIESIKEELCNRFHGHRYRFFNDVSSCSDYIATVSKTETLFLITSLSSIHELRPNSHSLRHLDSVFVHALEEKDETVWRKYSKIIGIFDQSEVLFQSIKENLVLTVRQAESFKFYQQHQKSTRELSRESGSFLWLKLFKDVVSKLPHDEQSKEEMIDKLKEYYRNNSLQLRAIEKFQREYKSDDATRWYTGQPFIYKQINRALRTEDIELLYKFRYFINDLSQKLLDEHQLLKDSFNSLTFYRGVRIPKEEFEKLQVTRVATTRLTLD